MTNEEVTYLHTFDYEMFLKESGTVEKCMLEPTERLIALFSRYKGTATFFVDTAFLSLLSRESESLYTRVADQIVKLIDNGHRVELHLHPSWENAHPLKPGQWEIRRFDTYNLESHNKNSVDRLFREGIEQLQNLAGKIDSTYRVSSFRAGGWSVGKSSLVSDMMREHGLLIDSSVAPGMYRAENQCQWFDFRRAPKRESMWRFSNHPTIPDLQGDLVEIPISTHRVNPLGALIKKIRKNIYREKNSSIMKIYGDGKGMSLSDVLSWEQIILERLRNAVLPKYVMLTLQDLMEKELEHNNQGLKNLVSISHPKKLSEGSFAELERSLEEGFRSTTLLDYYREN